MTSAIRSPTNISLLVLALALISGFVVWVGRQERVNRPALIPNSLWRNKVFTSIRINVILIWSAFDAFEQIVNFFFQDVQHLSPLQAAVRFLPGPVSGVLVGTLMGFIVHRFRADTIVVAATASNKLYSTCSDGCDQPSLVILGMCIPSYPP